MDGRRFKELNLSAKMFLSILQGYNREADNGRLRLPYIDQENGEHFPPDCQVVAVAADDQRDQLRLRLAHPSFPAVPDNCPVPELRLSFAVCSVPPELLDLWNCNRLSGSKALADALRKRADEIDRLVYK